MKGVIAALLLSLTVFAGDALAQKALKEQVVGTWIHVSTTVTSPDGKKSDRPGKGVLIYAPDGYFAFVNVAENLPRLASGNRARTTPEEAQAIVTNSLAYYGTYKVDETTKTIVPTVEGSTFPNMVGTDQSRVVTSITAHQMIFINPKTPVGCTLKLSGGELNKGPDEIEHAFANLIKGRAQGLIVLPHAVTNAHRARIVSLAAGHRLRGMYPDSEYVEAGGLMLYAPNYSDQHRAATLVDKILKGAKPADLPIEQPTRFELVVNLKTAKALGLTIPQLILVRVDRVIE